MTHPEDRRRPRPLLLAGAVGFAAGVLLSVGVWSLNDLALCAWGPTLILPLP
ncbi:hypothetical protein ACWFMI_14750 [Nocardiopsis terrae]